MAIIKPHKPNPMKSGDGNFHEEPRMENPTKSGDEKFPCVVYDAQGNEYHLERCDALEYVKSGSYFNEPPAKRAQPSN